MIKYSLLVLVFYSLYYLGVILYDLILKKEKNVNTNATEEFSIGAFSQEETPTTIGIDDVENMTTPKSYLQDEIISAEKNEEAPDIEEMRRKFEEEENLSEEGNVLKDENEKKNKNKENWDLMLNLSDSMVHMVANYDGQKVYHSII